MLSYKGRLANAHSISCKHLNDYLIGPSLNRIASAEEDKDNSRYAYKSLERLTSRPGLRVLQFPHDRKISIKGLEFRNIRAWCPGCLQEMRNEGSTIYEKHKWRFAVLKMCAKHQAPFAIRCPNEKCNRKQPIYHDIIQPGHCSYCGCSLANCIKPSNSRTISKHSFSGPHQTNPIHNYRSLDEHISKQKYLPFGLDKIYPANIDCPGCDSEFKLIDVKWQCLIEKSIGELIAQSQQLPPHVITRQRVHKSIVRCINRLFEGDIERFAKILQFNKTDLWSWYEGFSIPTFEEIMHICQHLDTSFLDFLTGACFVLWKPRNRNMCHRSTIHEARIKIVDTLRTKNMATPSFRDVVIGTGYDASSLFRSFPELCTFLIKRDRTRKKNPALQRIMHISRHVRKATIMCVIKHVYPTFYDVEVRLRKISSSITLEDSHAIAVWLDTLKQLRLAPFKGENCYESRHLNYWMRNHYENYNDPEDAQP